MNIKKSENINKYLDLSRELKPPPKQLWNMVTVIPMVVGAFRMVSKGLEKRQEELEIRGRIGSI